MKVLLIFLIVFGFFGSPIDAFACFQGYDQFNTSTIDPKKFIEKPCEGYETACLIEYEKTTSTVELISRCFESCEAFEKSKQSCKANKNRVECCCDEKHKCEPIDENLQKMLDHFLSNNSPTEIEKPIEDIERSGADIEDDEEESESYEEEENQEKEDEDEKKVIEIDRYKLSGTKLEKLPGRKLEIIE